MDLVSRLQTLSVFLEFSMSPLIGSNLLNIGTLEWSAIWAFGLKAMWPFPTIYGFAFVSVGRKLNQHHNNNRLVYLYFVFQALVLIFSVIYSVRILVTPLKESDSYIWILSVIFPGFLGMMSAYFYFSSI